jgi:hypothetical protein
MHLLTYSMEQSPSWEANWFAASQEILRVLWNPEVHHSTHKRPPPVPILSQPYQVLTPTSHFLKVHSNIIYPFMPGSPQRSISFMFPHQNPVHTSPFPHTCYMPARLILLDFISRTRLGKEYRPFSSSLCNFLHYPFTSSLLGSNILLNTLFSNTLSLRSSFNVSDHVSHPYKRRAKL